MTINRYNIASRARVQQLVSWFKWEKADMAIHYTRTKGLAADMGIKILPV